MSFICAAELIHRTASLCCKYRPFCCHNSGKEPNAKKSKVMLEEWEVKTLVQDIETSGHELEDIDLDKLTTKNPDFYGAPRNPKFRDRRLAVSTKVQELKRKSALSYLKLVRSFGVNPSKFTVENAQKTMKEMKKQKEVELAMEELNVNDDDDDDDDDDFIPPKAPPRMVANTPPRSILSPGLSKYIKKPDAATYYSGATVGSSTSCLIDDHTGGPFGSYERPWKFDIIPGLSCKYINNIWLYEETKQVKEVMTGGQNGKKKHSYSGYLFARQVDPPDVTLHSCFIADEGYVHTLIDTGIITMSESSSQFVVFRGPAVDAFDCVGKGELISHQWISTESKETAKTIHTNIKPATEGDIYPGPSWSYTIGKIPEGYILDNRVWSDHDSIVAPYESMPEKTKVKALGNEEVLAFHVQWRIALKGTEMLMDDNEKMSLAERMKKRRAQHGP